MAPSIDFGAVRTAANLRQVLVADLGAPSRGGRWPCPLHGGNDPNFGIEPDGLHCRCWTCGWRGDVLDYVMKRDGLTLVEAVRRLDPSAAADADVGKARTRIVRAAESKPPAPPTAEPWEDDHWQQVAGEIIAAAAARLWSPAGRAALGWLRGRGLRGHTLRRFRVGFVARPLTTGPIGVLGRDARGRPKGIYCPRGVVLPWVAPGSWHDAREPMWLGATVRRLMEDVNAPLPPDEHKCLSITGSRKGRLYPHPDVEPSQEGMPALLVEGELDALSGWQEAGALAVVGTIGGATTNPHQAALEALAGCSPWLVATDHDGAGSEAAWRWREHAPEKVRRVFLPHGKDINKFLCDGGDVAGWLREQMAKHAAAVRADPIDWREDVAGWPHEDWARWRRHAVELQAGFPAPRTAPDIRLADRLAYDELVAGDDPRRGDRP